MRDDDLPDDDELRARLETQGLRVDAAADQTIAAPAPNAGAPLKLAPVRLRDRGESPMESGADLEVVATLGEGGMGVVHLARQPVLRRDVAVKRLRDTSPRAVARLVREAQITGRLEHPNIVPVHALAIDADGQPVVVMKRVSGESWLELARRGEVGIERHIEIAIAVCNAASFAHERGVVHRDIKPENVMVGALDEVYLVDWGVALDREDADSFDRSAVVGTPSYMAPEMIAGDPSRIDARTDVYLLGASLHHAVVGAPRHDSPRIVTALHLAASSAPHDYGDAVPHELAAILNRACHRDPERRYPSALALREALKAFLDHRAARELAMAASERVEELDRLLAGAPEDGPEPAEVRRAWDEAMFAFRQSLRVHDDEEVRREMRAAAERLFDHRIARGDAGGAAALIDVLAHDDARRHEALQALRSGIAAREARLAWLERERDPSLGRRERVLLALGTSVIGLGAGVYSLAVTPGPETLRLRVMGMVLLPLILLGVAMAAFRRRLLVNELGRGVAFTLAVGLGLVVVNRFLHLWIAPEGSGSTMLQSDVAILTACVSTLMLRLRWIAVPATALLVIWALMAALPSYQVGLMIAAGITAPALVGWVYWRAGRERR